VAKIVDNFPGTHNPAGGWAAGGGRNGPSGFPDRRAAIRWNCRLTS